MVRVNFRSNLSAEGGLQVTSVSSDEQGHGRKNTQQHNVHRSRYRVAAGHVLTKRKAPDRQEEGEFRDQHKAKREHADAKPQGWGRWQRTTPHQPPHARMVTMNMMGASISSAFLVPKLGTTQSIRMVPITKPLPNTTAK